MFGICFSSCSFQSREMIPGIAQGFHHCSTSGRFQTKRRWLQLTLAGIHRAEGTGTKSHNRCCAWGGCRMAGKAAEVQELPVPTPGPGRPSPAGALKAGMWCGTDQLPFPSLKGNLVESHAFDRMKQMLSFHHRLKASRWKRRMAISFKALFLQS